MKKGNQLQVFYYNGSAYKTFNYSTANGLNYSVDTESISSKDHGLANSKVATTSNWEFSGSGLFDTTSAAAALNMAKSGQQYSFAFGSISQSNWEKGLKDVGAIDSSIVSWTPGTDFIQYGDGILTSFSITANDGQNATADYTISGCGSLSTTAPAHPTGYTG
jgi:hypothetical protein